MTSLLHQAIRSTNAQYDDPEILSQLEVKLLDSFDGEHLLLQFDLRKIFKKNFI